MLLLALPQRVWQYNAGCGPAVFMQQGCAEALLPRGDDAAVLQCLLYASTTTEDSAARLKNRWPPDVS